MRQSADSGHNRKLMERDGVFRVRSGTVVLLRFLLLLPLVSTLGLAIFIILAVRAQRYIDLDTVSFFGLLTGYFWILWATLSDRRTSYVGLCAHSFTFKKWGRKPARYSYAAILTYHERHESGRGGPFDELTVYLADNWFALRSDQFTDYDYLKERFTPYGQAVPYRTVFTLPERNRLRWMIGGMVLLIGGTVALGFVMHNPADPNPAQLISLIDTVEQVRENRNKGRLTGVTIRTRAFPQFAFSVSRRDYDVRFDSLASAITPERPVSLLIRQSDFRKKLTKTEPLTFGDTYEGYYVIGVFGVTQGDLVSIQTNQPVDEPTHTNPLLRTFLLSILLLCCWTGWVYVDWQPVLRAD